MPELPEVETIARELRPVLERSSIARVDVRFPGYVRGKARAIEGRRVGEVRRHGKRLLIDLEPAGGIAVHLGMSGQLTLESSRREIADHVHLRVTLRGRRTELRLRDPRRFGGAWIWSSDPEEITLSPLGADALSVSWPVFRLLLARSRQVKALLLDQRALAGLGNIYCDEALYAARVHPRAIASTLDERIGRALHCEIGRVLRRAIADGGSTLRDYRRANGAPGAFQNRHRVYGRAGEPCRTCGTIIVREAVAGRSTHLCPRCQRSPTTRSGRSARRRG